MRLMQTCFVDSWEAWDSFFKPFAISPVGHREVWVGYDPNGENDDGDSAGLAGVLPARSKDDKHRVIEKYQCRGMDYEEQAGKIPEICRRFDGTPSASDVT